MTKIPRDHAFEFLRMELEGTLEFRREKAVYHPDDTRNVEAVEILKRLVAQIGELADAKLFDDYAAALVTMTGNQALEFRREADDYRRRIGFDRFPSTTEDYLVDLLEIVDRVVRVHRTTE